MDASRRSAALAAAIGVSACVLAAAAGWDNSATNDEPYHLLAGYSYATEGHNDLNPEHPPLVKLLAGVALLPLHLRGTQAPPVRRLLTLSAEVRRFLYFNTASPATIMRVARLAMLPFLALLLAGVYAWARWALGEREALLALVAVAAQPLVLGHAFVVHTDVPAAAAWTWTLYLLHRWLAGWRGGWLAFGAALGLGLLIKFTAIYLVPLATLAVLVKMLRSRSYALLPRLAGAGAVAMAILVAGMAIPLRNGDLAEERATIGAMLQLWPGTTALSQRLQGLAEVSRPFAHYGLGLSYVYETNLHGQGVNFFLGNKAVHGFTWYFPVALMLKTSLPFQALLAWGLVGVARRRAPLDLALLLVAFFYLGISLGTSYNIGARHLLPLLPLLAIVGSHHTASLGRWPQRALLTAFLISVVATFPHYIAHFNLLAGGARNGSRYLNDSNLDWGQDWTRLAQQATSRGWRPMAYVYLGAGYPRHDMPEAVDALDLPALPEDGYVAVSSWAAAVGVPYLQALHERVEAKRLAELLDRVGKQGETVGEVGSTITVYRLCAAKPP